MVQYVVVQKLSPDATAEQYHCKQIFKEWRCKQSELVESFETFSQSWISLKFVHWTRIDGLVVQYVVQKLSPDATVERYPCQGIFKEWRCEQSELTESFEVFS